MGVLPVIFPSWGKRDSPVRIERKREYYLLRSNFQLLVEGRGLRTWDLEQEIFFREWRRAGTKLLSRKGRMC